MLRGKDSPYQIVNNGESGEEIINHFKLHLKNQTFEDLNLQMAIPNTWKEKKVVLVSQSETINLEGGMNSTLHIFIKFPRSLIGIEGSKNIELDFIDTTDNKIKTQENVKLVGPKSI